MTLSEDTARDVVIVGAGPTGLMLAGELAGAGASVTVVDRATEPASLPKANGVVGRAGPVLAARGLLHGTGLRVLRTPRFRFGPLTLRLGLLLSPLHVLPVPQQRVEEMLEACAVTFGAEVLRGREVVGIDDSRDGVTITTSGSPDRLRARFVVGCDGAHSFVRKAVGIGFPGFTSPTISRIARVTIPDDSVARSRDTLDVAGVGTLVPFVPNRRTHGSLTIAPLAALDRAAPADLYLVASHEPRDGAAPTDTLGEDELRGSLRRVLGADLPFTTATAGRSLVPNSRLAERFRVGRVFLAGDAAHVFGAGGSAISAGLLDAVSLAGTLTAVLRDDEPRAPGDGTDARLDRYETERRPAAERTLGLTRLQLALEGDDDLADALRGVVGELVRDRRVARRIAALMEG